MSNACFASRLKVTDKNHLLETNMTSVLRNRFLIHTYSLVSRRGNRAGKCPAMPAAPLPGNIEEHLRHRRKCFCTSQEMFSILALLTKVNQFTELS